MVDNDGQAELTNEIIPIDKEFIVNAFAQSRDVPQSTSSLQGKLFPNYVSVLRTAVEELHQLRADLPAALLKPKGDMGLQAFHLYQSLDPVLQRQIDELRDKKEKGLNSLIHDKVAPTLMPQILPVDILKAPQTYHAQEDRRTCAIANFRMILRRLQGQQFLKKT